MGRYILLEFDDDTTADRLCAQINAASAKGKRFRVIGIFPKPPKKRCECAGVNRDNTRTRTWSRHKKLGFTYCLVCKKVLPGWQSPKNFLDHPDLPAACASLGFTKEATLHLDKDGTPIKNYPITDRLQGTKEFKG